MRTAGHWRTTLAHNTGAQRLLDIAAQTGVVFANALTGDTDLPSLGLHNHLLTKTDETVHPRRHPACGHGLDGL